MAIASGLMKVFARRGEGRNHATETTFLHTTARTCGWRLDTVEESLALRSYGWARAQWRDVATFIILHNEGAAAAFTTIDPQSDPWNHDFVNRPEFVQAASDLQWPVRFLSAAELAEPLSHEDRAFPTGLDSAMAYDVRHWNPQTVAAVVFNYWD